MNEKRENAHFSSDKRKKAKLLDGNHQQKGFKMARPTNTSIERKPILEKEFKKLITYTKSDYSIKEHRRIRNLQVFLFLYYSACRVSEIVNLTFKDLKIIIDKKEFSLGNNTKTKKPRLIYFSDNAIKELKQVFQSDMEKFENNAYLFRSWNKPLEKMNVSAFTRELNKYIHLVLGKLYSTHSFRQGSITDMAMKSVNPKIIQKFIGHKNIATTLRYVTPSEQDIKNSLAR